MENVVESGGPAGYRSVYKVVMMALFFLRKISFCHIILTLLLPEVGIAAAAKPPEQAERASLEILARFRDRDSVLTRLCQRLTASYPAEERETHWHNCFQAAKKGLVGRARDEEAPALRARLEHQAEKLLGLEQQLLSLSDRARLWEGSPVSAPYRSHAFIGEDIWKDLLAGYGQFFRALDTMISTDAARRAVLQRAVAEADAGRLDAWKRHSRRSVDADQLERLQPFIYLFVLVASFLSLYLYERFSVRPAFTFLLMVFGATGLSILMVKLMGAGYFQRIFMPQEVARAARRMEAAQRQLQNLEQALISRIKGMAPLLASPSFEPQQPNQESSHVRVDVSPVSVDGPGTAANTVKDPCSGEELETSDSNARGSAHPLGALDGRDGKF